MMRTYNTLFTTLDDLEGFIRENKIEKSQNVLVQIFTGLVDEIFIQHLIDSLKKIIPHIQIIGSTTDGEILDGKVKELSTVLSFSIFEKTQLQTYFQPYENSPKLLAKKLYQQFSSIENKKLFLTFIDGLNINGEEYIKAFGALNNDLVIAGGLAGDNAHFQKTYVFTQDTILEKGAVGVLLSSTELLVGTNLSFGWNRIGKKLKITKAKENIVYTIEDIPAIDMYLKYLGSDISNDLPATGVEFPLILNRNGIDIARAVVGVNKEDGSMQFAGNVAEGEYVQFGYGNVDMIQSKIPHTMQKITQDAVEAIFIYSCMARKRLLGKEIESEMLPLAKMAPLSGFFTYGELFTHNNSYELLNQTMTVLTLSENSTSKVSGDFVERKSKDTHKRTINALTHLVGVATQELEELNEKLETKVKEEVEKNRQKDITLLRQSRLAQMGEMISMIAHQWRQPLSAISSAAAGLKVKAQLHKVENEMIIEISDKILYSSQYLSSTINDFRDFYKANKETKECSFTEMLDGVLSIIGSQIKNRGITLELDLQAKEKIRTYPNEVKQVVMNLLKNAEDALLMASIKDPYIKIKTYKEGEEFILEVSDNAGGIEETILQKIFDPYFSTKKEKDGTGLGLYMSKTIIENHCNGQLIAYNNKEGATFRIELKSKES